MLNRFWISGTCEVNVLLYGSGENVQGSANTANFSCETYSVNMTAYGPGDYKTCQMPSGSTLTLTCFASANYMLVDTDEDKFYYDYLTTIDDDVSYKFNCVDGVLTAGVLTAEKMTNGKLSGEVHTVWCGDDSFYPS